MDARKIKTTVVELEGFAGQPSTPLNPLSCVGHSVSKLKALEHPCSLMLILVNFSIWINLLTRFRNSAQPRVRSGAKLAKLAGRGTMALPSRPGNSGATAYTRT